MKITRKQIRRIIREEIETLSQEEKTISAEEQESAMLARDRAEDLDAVEGAWEGGANLVHPIDFENESLTDDKVVRGHQILKIVESIVSEGRMKERYAEIEDAVLSIVSKTPSISGLELVDGVKKELEDYGMVDPSLEIEKEEVFSVLDNMQEEGSIFFDAEEDAWFLSMEDLMAYREEGGVWSDEKDYEAGWYR